MTRVKKTRQTGAWVLEKETAASSVRIQVAPPRGTPFAYPLRSLMGKRRLSSLLFQSLLLSLLTAGQAMAHHQPPGMEEVDEFAGEPLTAALAHPLTGTDHWLAAVAVGLTVWSCGRKTGMLAGISFLLAMAAGIVSGRLTGAIPVMESGLAVSVILAGGVVAGGRWVSRQVVQVFAVAAGMWHGLAHGMEMPAAVPAGVYATGLVLGSGGIVLLAAAVASGLPGQRPELPRWAGGSLVAAGAWLLVAGLVS